MASRRRPTDAELSIRRLAAAAEPEFRARFLAVVSSIRDRFTLGQLAALIEAGRAEEAFRFVEATARQLGLSWTGAYQTAGGAAAATVNRAVGSVHLSFDGVNYRAVDAMRRNSLRMVREFSAEQRAATHQALLEGVRRGANPVEQARAFRQSIGLTRYQERAVQNYRGALEAGGRDALTRELRDRRFDRTVASAADAGEALSASQIDTMVERYRERYVKYRAEAIARTEALGAAHEGADEGFRQAVESGDVPAERISRTWNTAEDSRVRDSHREMDGQVVDGLDEPFISGDGNRLRYPGDPAAPPEDRIQCRCSLSTRITAPAEPAPVRISILGGS